MINSKVSESSISALINVLSWYLSHVKSTLYKSWLITQAIKRRPYLFHKNFFGEFARLLLYTKYATTSSAWLPRMVKIKNPCLGATESKEMWVSLSVRFRSSIWPVSATAYLICWIWLAKSLNFFSMSCSRWSMALIRSSVADDDDDDDGDPDPDLEYICLETILCIAVSFGSTFCLPIVYSRWSAETCFKIACSRLCRSANCFETSTLSASISGGSSINEALFEKVGAWSASPVFPGSVSLDSCSCCWLLKVYVSVVTTSRLTSNESGFSLDTAVIPK